MRPRCPSSNSNTAQISAAFDHVEVALRNLVDSGNTATIRSPLAILAAIFDRLGHHVAAATLTGFAVGPMATAGFPELDATLAHLRDVLGETTYQAHARAGASMTAAAIANYAYDQINAARPGLDNK